ncbi:MAG: hypothetical protein AAFU85_18380 [Planctomycetota bacterium]
MSTKLPSENPYEAPRTDSGKPRWSRTTRNVVILNCLLVGLLGCGLLYLYASIQSELALESGTFDGPVHYSESTIRVPWLFLALYFLVPNAILLTWMHRAREID